MRALLLLTAALGRPPPENPPHARVLSALGGDPTSAALFEFCSAFASAGAGTLPAAQVRRACELCGSESCPTPTAAHVDGGEDDASLRRRHEADLLLAGRLEREGEEAGRHASVTGALHAIDNVTRLKERGWINGTGNGTGAQRRPLLMPPSSPPPSPSLPLLATLRANLVANLQTSANIVQGQRALEEGVALVVSEGVILVLLSVALCCCCVLRAYKRI